MQSPCRGCTRRKVGCHDVKTCKEWKVYIEAAKVTKERRRSEKYGSIDWNEHVKRRERRKPPMI